MTRYLNLHVLYSFAGANPNRDDTGTPKSLQYGGVERSRMSAQAMTRSKRRGYEDDSDGEKSYRSALLPKQVAERAQRALEANGERISDATATDLLAGATKAINDLVMDDDKAAVKAAGVRGAGKKKSSTSTGTDTVGQEPEEEAGDTLVWLAEAEVAAAAAALATAHSTTNDTFDPADFLQPSKTGSLSIAAFGRMFAQRPELQTEAAVQRASAFTTHPSVIDIDYFAAVDDLRTQDRGAGFLSQRQDTGGVYYWHANIDRHQLWATWDTSLIDDPEANLRAFLTHLIIDLPHGGQTHSGHHSLPAYVMIVDAVSPVSLQTAYEQPISGEDGHLSPSITALNDEHARVTRFLPDHFGHTTITGTHADDSDALPLNEAVDRAVAWIMAGRP